MKNYKAIHIVIIICISLFVIFTSIAMIIYPGGSWIDINSSGFSFSINFFSDLSRRTTFQDDSNLISSALFTISLILIGGAIICYFIMMFHNFKEQKDLKKISLVASIIGIIIALVYLSLGFTPSDKYLGTHMILIIISFSIIIFLLLTWAALIFLNIEYPNFYGYLFTLFFLLCIGFFAIIITQDFDEFITYIRLRAIYQKVIVYTGITIFIIQTIGSLRYQIKESR